MPSRTGRGPIFWMMLSTAVVVVAFFGAALYAWHAAKAIDDLAESIVVNANPSIQHLDDARTELHAMGALVNAAFFEQRTRAPFPHDAFERDRWRLHDAVEAYLALPFFAAERSRWQAVSSSLAEAEAQLDAVVDRLDAGDVAGAAALRDGRLGSALEKADLALGRQIAFDVGEGSRLGREIGMERRAAQTKSYALHGVAAALAMVMLAVSGDASRRYVRALRQAREAEAAMSRKLEGVAEAAVSVAEHVGSSDASDVLRIVADAARAIGRADLAAVGMGADRARALQPFVASGVDAAVANHPQAPRPVGVLGTVVQKGETLAVADASKNAAFVELPEGYPPVGPFLGTAVRLEQHPVGLLYLARRPGSAPFGEQDARAAELLATFVATALQNTALYTELRQEVQRREDLLSAVSHDLRNPLSAMGLDARTLQHVLAEDARARRHADRIARNAARMDRMIADLLAVARLQAGGVLPVDLQAQDPGPIVRDAVDAFAAVAADRGVSLRAELAQELPAACCDAARIGQVLANLVGNALKFTPRGGSVVVSAHAAEGAKEVCFSVRDTGGGIPPDALEHVFERFWQRPQDAARGTGLGLYIAKGIVDAHHGKIWVTSRSGEGSDFRFTVPAARPLEVDGVAEELLEPGDRSDR